MNRQQVINQAVKLLTDDPNDQARLADAIETALYEGIYPLQGQLQAYSMLGTYYAIVKDKKRQLRGPEKFAYQLVEDALEGWLKTLDRGIIATQHLNNLTGRHNI